MKSNEVLTFWMTGSPYSADPIDYDAFIHHVMFTSVLSPIVSQYRVGQITGLLASSWDKSADSATWVFRMNPEAKFSNGDRIDGKAVCANWMRIAYLMKQGNSNSGMFEYLEGFDAIASANSQIAGMSCDSSQVTLKFTRAMPDLLLRISFGLYAIAHPSSFDSSTGKWLAGKSVIASGPYEIADWTPDLFSLKLRADYPKSLIHPKAFQRIEIRNTRDVGAVNSSDVILSNSSNLIVDDGYKFLGPVASNIRYVQCNSAKDPQSPCSDIELRRQMRTTFYKNMLAAGFKTERSFFPLTMKGIREPEDIQATGESKAATRRSRSITYPTFPPSMKLAKYGDRLDVVEAFQASVAKIREDLPIQLEGLPFADQRVADANSFDLMFRYTGVRVEAPEHDVRFMVLSKEGIQLPDTDGRLTKAAARDVLDPQEINQILWDQAVIWPVDHFSVGLWARPERVDMSMMNLVLPPTAFQFMGAP
jgi:hypothetical protein